MATIALLGNHSESFSTESDLDWTLEKLGHTVLKLQENDTHHGRSLMATS